MVGFQLLLRVCRRTQVLYSVGQRVVDFFMVSRCNVLVTISSSLANSVKLWLPQYVLLLEFLSK